MKSTEKDEKTRVGSDQARSCLIFHSPVQGVHCGPGIQVWAQSQEPTTLLCC